MRSSMLLLSLDFFTASHSWNQGGEGNSLHGYSGIKLISLILKTCDCMDFPIGGGEKKPHPTTGQLLSDR